MSMEKQKRILIALVALVANISLFGCMNVNDSSTDSSQNSEGGNTSQENFSSSGGNGDSEASEVFVDGDGIMKDPYDDLD